MRDRSKILLGMVDGLLAFADQAFQEAQFIGYRGAAAAMDRVMDELREAKQAAEKQKAAE